jgi:hypothetical protein
MLTPVRPARSSLHQLTGYWQRIEVGVAADNHRTEAYSNRRDQQIHVGGCLPALTVEAQ